MSRQDFHFCHQGVALVGDEGLCVQSGGRQSVFVQVNQVLDDGSDCALGLPGESATDQSQQDQICNHPEARGHNLISRGREGIEHLALPRMSGSRKGGGGSQTCCPRLVARLSRNKRE